MEAAEVQIQKNYARAEFLNGRFDSSAKIMARSKYAKPMIEVQDSELLRILTKKPISPLRDEILINPRSRSAKLRAAIRKGASK